MEKHRKQAKKLGVYNQLIMTGYRTDVVDFYQMSDIFIFPSIREGLPVALIEAMVSGMPCIATKNRGTKDLLDGIANLLDSKDIAALIKMIQDYISNIGTRRAHTNIQKYDVARTLMQVKTIMCGLVRHD